MLSLIHGMLRYVLPPALTLHWVLPWLAAAAAAAAAWLVLAWGPRRLAAKRREACRASNPFVADPAKREEARRNRELKAQRAKPRARGRGSRS